MASIQDWTIPGAEGEPIYGTTHLPPAGVAPRGVLLICHGFKGYKDYGFFPKLAEVASGRGLIAHRFNFSHSGVTRDFETFARPDLFEKDTWGKQVADLFAVAGASVGGLVPGCKAGAGLPVVWFGHSRGGVTVILGAGQVFTGRGRVGVPRPVGVVAAAAPQACMSLDADQIQRLRHRGSIESPSSRTGQVLRVGKGWLEEIEAEPDVYDPAAVISGIACPILLVHGDADQTVDVSAARVLANAAGGRAELHEIAGASHTFDSPNPLGVDEPGPAATERVIGLTCDFAVRVVAG